MKTNIKPTPCMDCPKKDKCLTKCSRFENWFRVSWREVVKPFREIYKQNKSK